MTRQKNLWHFNNAVLEVESSITDELNNFIGILRGGAGFVAEMPDLDPERFESWVNRLQMKRWYPGVQGVGLAVKLEPGGDTNAIAERLRAAGIQHFSVYPDGNRKVKFPVVLLEPHDPRNEHAIGYDMFSEPVRHAAMMYAATNGPAVSGKVTLVQEIYAQKQAGFLLYVPVFRPGPFPQNEEQRQAALAGFLYSPFRAGDFFNAIFRAERGSRLHFKIYDGTSVNETNLLYESTNAASAHPWISTTRVLNAPGHQWTIAFDTTPAFQQVLGGKTAILVPATGIFASLFIFAFTMYFVRQHEELLRRGAERDKAQREAELLNRELENRVRERTSELQETNSQLESFIYTVAHDLRTPLRSMRGFAEILQEDLGSKIDGAARQYTERIIHSAGEMDRLIRDLLTYSQVSRAKMEIVPVDLDGLLAEVREEFDPEINERHATVVIQPHLPRVLANATTLRQVFINLVGNALKFVKPGESADVRVGSEDGPDGCVRVWVEDKGVGIEPEHHQRIFGVFERLEPESYPGTGIGLAIVRRAVERMGGRVGVESEHGNGSRFFVELPKA